MLRVFVCDDSECFSGLVAAYLERHENLDYPEAMATTIVGAADGYVGKGGTATALIAAIRALAG